MLNVAGSEKGREFPVMETISLAPVSASLPLVIVQPSQVPLIPCVVRHHTRLAVSVPGWGGGLVEAKKSKESTL